MRSADDHVGHQIDASQRVYERLAEEQRNLMDAGHVPDDGGAALLHMLVTTWVDEVAKEGVLVRHTHHLDDITRALAELGARVQHEKVRRACG